jgi:SAM-dependent methyltransferase
MNSQEIAIKQFGSHAVSYLVSPVHATGPDLERLAAGAREMSSRHALDLGCGAGHASFALARGGAPRITACDPSADMLAVVAREAATRGHHAIATQLAASEQLPFESGTFDFVVTRYSAHHWADVPRALAECARVLVPGGRLIVIDVVAPEAPLLDTALQVVEFLRDASHVRDYRVSEWRALQSAAGFAAAAVDRWKIAIDFPSWIARIGTAADRVKALQAVVPALPQEVREYFRFDPQHSFAIDTAWIEAVKPG